MRTQLAVLGGGPGGYAAAFLAADLGMEVVLVEAEPRLGGTCLLKGCIPSKALLHVAKVIHEARDLAEWGVAFDRPRPNVDALRARKDKVIQTLAGGLKQLAGKRKVRIIQARGTFASSNALKLASTGKENASDDTLQFEHCIVATGSVPARIPALDLPTPRVMDSTGALELPDIPGSLLVIGGGYIGLEMATVYAALGSRVTVVELTEGLLPGADRDLVKPLHAKLEGMLAAIHLRTRVKGLTDRQEQIEVAFETSERQWNERFDRVLVCVGRRPASQGLGLENTRVEVDDRGFVCVDDQQRTADPQIQAIGDVAGEPMLAHKATYEGKTAVEVLHGEPVRFDALAVPAVVFTDPEIAWAGLTEEQATREGREVEIARYPWGASGRAQALGRTDGMTKLLIDRATDRLLGIGLVGAGAGDLIAEGVLAIEMGASVRDLTQSIHPHPTLSETLSGAGDLYLGLATELYRPRRSRD